MKKLIGIILIFNWLSTSKAQCPEYIENQQIEAGMLIFCSPEDGGKYVAEIKTVTPEYFTCTFLKSGNNYTFSNPELINEDSKSLTKITVISNRGGKYKRGTSFFANFYMPDPDPCDLNSISPVKLTQVIVTFPDNKFYLGAYINGIDGYYFVKFTHSSSDYTFSKDGKVVTVKNGGYAVGTPVSVVHARLLSF